MADNPQILIISQNIGGQLQIHTDWPTPLRQEYQYWIFLDKIQYSLTIFDILMHQEQRGLLCEAMGKADPREHHRAGVAESHDLWGYPSQLSR